MKAGLIIFALLLASSSCLSIVSEVSQGVNNQPTEPECVLVLNRNILKTEKGIEKLTALLNTDTPASAINRDLQRFKSTIAGLDQSIEICKSANPDFDFSALDDKVLKIKSDFKLLQDANNANADAETKQKTWIDVNKYSIFIFSFPTSHPPTLDMTASWIFTREEVVFYLSDQSDDTQLKNNLRKFKIILNSESTKKAFLTTISDMKGQVDKAKSVVELKNLIHDVEHLTAVFLPGSRGLLQVINSAKAMHKQLSQ